MREYLTKLCMFLFLAAIFSGRTNELGVLTGALTGTILLWPLYRKFVPAPKRRRVVVIDEEADIAEETRFGTSAGSDYAAFTGTRASGSPSLCTYVELRRM